MLLQGTFRAKEKRKTEKNAGTVHSEQWGVRMEGRVAR